jgi:hypothetical protein
MQFLPQSPRYEQWTMLNFCGWHRLLYLSGNNNHSSQSSLSAASAAPLSAAESVLAATSPSEEGVMEEDVSEEDVSAEPQVSLCSTQTSISDVINSRLPHDLPGRTA